MKQIEDNRTTPDADVSKYITDDCHTVTLSEFMHRFIYADATDETYSFTSVKKIIEVGSGEVYADYITKNITRPLKMKSVSFPSDADKFCCATVADYARFCDVLFAGDEALLSRRILSIKSTAALIDVIFENKENKEIIRYENDNEFVIIDISKKLLWYLPNTLRVY